MAVVILIVFAQIHFIFADLRECPPNNWVLLNDRLCHCNQNGFWSDQRCRSTERQCSPGQVIYLNRTRCTCQKNGLLSCINNMNSRLIGRLESKTGVDCVPYSTFYYECNICLCPKTGRSLEARCVANRSCLIKKLGMSSKLSSDFDSNNCVPNSIHKYQCITCRCTENGYFLTQSCVNSCSRTRRINIFKCIPGKLYKNQCNICYCPENSERNENLCTKSICDSYDNTQPLNVLRTNTAKCEPLRFTEPRCLYCEYNSKGINTSTCFEQKCVNVEDMEDNSESHTDEQIAIICSQCFCPRNGYINERYCTKNCSSKTRRIMFEKFLKDDNHAVVQVVNQQKDSSLRTCRSNYFYRDQNRICLCPDNGKTNKELCLSITEQTKETDTNATGPGTKTGEIDFDINCESNTFITYDCNICYCNKTGKLDPKWCTYDDCETKKNLQESQKTKPAHLEPNYYSCNKSGNLSLESCTAHNGSNITTAQDFGVHDPSLPSPNATCEPGSLTKVRCNLCICPKSGLEIDRVCTNNNCSENIEETAKATNYDEIHCEPLAYYTVDCNVCFCPKEGIKNLAKCTNNICEKRYLRSSSCNPGELFSESCNICICPRNGDLLGRVCTDRDCNDHVARSMLFQLSQGLLPELNETHSLDICFPGEEFVVGCNLCVCPDMGLRAYSICTPMFCDERNHAIQEPFSLDSSVVIKRERRDADNACITYNITNTAERTYCTPGTMYYIRCRQCYCPYLGNINNFCRPLPKNFHCEQAYPNFNYLPMGRRHDVGLDRTDLDVNASLDASKSFPETSTSNITVTIRHEHTMYRCDENDTISDECYVCECKDAVIIREHCFKSDADKCTDALPTFLKLTNKIT